MHVTETMLDPLVEGIDSVVVEQAWLGEKLGDERPVDLLLQDAEALAGTVRRVDPQNEEDQADAG
ncbi:DUF6420 family protein [Streptomyces sp. NPDC048362]|uniref:DUF6420 family protein n=1 Tax=Streptomyces sp. NPDC048362 TaxID=3365539 RepID=UPI00371D66B4